MIVGDLLDWHDKRWLVRKIDPQTQTAYLESQDLETAYCFAEEKIRVICNPVLEWPVVTIPHKLQGRLLKVERASFPQNVPLVRFVDWVKMDELQIGGSLFLSPALKLGYRDRLVAVYEKGRLPIEIPRLYSPVAAKLPAPVAAPHGPPTLFDHLLDDDE